MHNVISILTPFAEQEEVIRRELQEAGIQNINEIKIGTVHKMQGAEKELILISTVYDEDSSGKFLRMIDGNINLINVMMSRAKQSIYVFGHPAIFSKAKHGSATHLIKKYLGIANS